MQIWISKYQLIKKKGGIRKGALLKVEFAHDLIGHADLHPWQEFDDLSLEEEIEQIEKGKWTKLSKRSLHFAMQDAQSRKKEENWFSQTQMPESRALLDKVGPVDDWIKLGFHSFKFKISSPILPIIPSLSKLTAQKIDICLDANSQLKYEEFETLFQMFPHIIFEDPIPFNPIIWEKFQDKGAILAADKEALQALKFPKSAQYLVVKPAIQKDTIFEQKTTQKIIVTSYLDHPVGQLCAAYTAALFIPDSISGIATHHFYLPTKYSSALGSTPYLQAPGGNGLGFNNFLENEPWKSVIFS